MRKAIFAAAVFMLSGSAVQAQAPFSFPTPSFPTPSIPVTPIPIPNVTPPGSPSGWSTGWTTKWATPVEAEPSGKPASTYSAKPVTVSPYAKSDGTFVQGHYRTSPNATRTDNYSTRPNINQYTGKLGTRR